MSIYIKTNMKEMPKCCEVCPEKAILSKECWARNTPRIKIDQKVESRPDWCPLVEIPDGQATKNK